MVTRIKLLIFIMLPIAAGLYFFAENYKEQKTEEDQIIELASDAYLKVADLNLVIPIVALLELRYAYSSYSFSLGSNASDNKALLEERAQFKELSAKPETAPQLDRVEILIRQYQYTGEQLSSQHICPLLKREWARYFCKGEYQEIMRKLPEKFYIVDKGHIDLFAWYYTVGQEKVADQIRRLDLKPMTAGAVCDADGKFCTAGIETSPDTLAVWTVWPSDKPIKSAQQMAEFQGEAIVAFVKYAIGPQPDFKKMQSETAAELK